MVESIQLFPLNKHTKKIKVVQIASETDAMLWQLRNFPGLPSSLEYFLKSDILKVGHAISEDVVQLKNEFNITSQHIFDTLPWAIEMNCKPLTLHALCAIFLGWRISKGLQTSNWDRRELSMNQVHYACTDAWASLMLYKEMKSYAERNCYLFPLPIESVDNILDTRLDTKRKRRRRHVKNYKARRNYELMINNATFITE
ncbi:ribonuclease D-like [Xenia sp. Carnegie-2017]|uniref:ribonuclease D-like n=1 Tax=Xenia sp. Carnegie-2017 TaxID=2897299 RepID=UPI001F03F333|nr:ribonuclease D-like [Xenia sp. Carnegie-2017]